MPDPDSMNLDPQHWSLKQGWLIRTSAECSARAWTPLYETSQRATGTHQPTFFKAALIFFKVTKKSKEPINSNLILRSQMLKKTNEKRKLLVNLRLLRLATRCSQYSHCKSTIILLKLNITWTMTKTVFGSSQWFQKEQGSRKPKLIRIHADPIWIMIYRNI